MYYLYALLANGWLLIFTTENFPDLAARCNPLANYPRCLVFYAAWNQSPQTEPDTWSLYSSPARDVDIQLLDRGDQVAASTSHIRGYTVTN